MSELEKPCLLVLTTVGTKQFAAGLAQSIVSARLAACVQISAVHSVYRWQGEVRTEPEWQLAIKTTRQRYEELEQHIRANHSYETPEIVSIEISGGSAAYIAWLRESVS